MLHIEIQGPIKKMTGDKFMDIYERPLMLRENGCPVAAGDPLNSPNLQLVITY